MFSCSACVVLHLPWKSLVFVLSVDYVSGGSHQENGVQTNQYSSISPPGSPVGQEEPFSTYFEEKVPIPENTNEVQISSHIFMEIIHFLILVMLGSRALY